MESSFTDELTTHKALIKKAKSSKSKEYKKRGKKTYTKHEVNVLVEKMLKKAFKGRKKCKQELRTFEKMDVSRSEESGQSHDNSNASSNIDDSWRLSSN